MDYFRTMYEKCYDCDEYYWGLEPASFLKDLIQVTGKNPSELRVLDIGCGEGSADARFLHLTLQNLVFVKQRCWQKNVMLKLMLLSRILMN